MGILGRVVTSVRDLGFGPSLLEGQLEAGITRFLGVSSGSFFWSVGISQQESHPLYGKDIDGLCHVSSD